ncbi:glyoxylase-like metal-dependent hydrolase (beta-lactamase superfamily II) [Polaromonas sp. CG_9.5]|uniref:MBL fold metallo-hydrolase n=1 Tax=Polaromonas sp. CG_9.5 TaxID=3071705 RepID=UPI002DFE5C70|nr:glyoxylase-like metal-dependent hydrolase (beta-lactamase superfamily II) [Polaromonas sp. CG_9.5]
MNPVQKATPRLTRLCAALACCVAGAAFSPLAAAHDDSTPKTDIPQVAAARAQVYKANPELVKSIMRGGGFGTELSYAIANHMYSRTNAPAIADARAKLKIEPLAERTWLLRFPIVNVVVFETDEGLVLIDSGYAPAGPALVDALKQISNKPVHTVVLTHFHADHAFGAWALLAAGMKPRIITEERFVEQMEEDMRTHGLIARNNQQPLTEVPRTWADAVKPTETFHRKTTLKIGGEDFVLTHARGETEDQIWVSVPGRKIVVSADYFQGFLPNAGNGKRRQRYPEEWAQALLDMAALKPQLLLPMHGPALTQAAEIQDRLGAQAQMLQSISKQVVDGLNAGERRDLVIDRVALPPELAKRDDARELYVSARDIGRMVVQEHSGWWDDIPSHWAPAPLIAQARELAALAGGPHALMTRALALADQSPALAANLADWAWLASEQDPAIVQGALQVYAKRVAKPLPTQEALVYAEHMGRLQFTLNQLDANKP